MLLDSDKNYLMIGHCLATSKQKSSPAASALSVGPNAGQRKKDDDPCKQGSDNDTPRRICTVKYNISGRTEIAQ